MAYRWHAVGGPTLCAFWAAKFLFISVKTYDLGVYKNRLVKHSNLGFGCFPSIIKLCFRHSKEMFRWDGSFEHPKHMSVIFVYYRNCYFCCIKSVRLVCSHNVHWSRINQRMRDDQIKINFSSFMPLIRHLKTSNKTIIADDLNKRHHLLT